ncbi:MAG: hypothetical protein HDS65_05365 [Bacteroidales bacterium]|nr:hypothetical protein [Bacteroidales bacterium]
MKIKYLLFLLPLLCSCASLSWYETNLNSRGSMPDNKRYFISTSDSLLLNTLEFKEYAQLLKDRLNEDGYIEADPHQADLVIYLDYSLGERILSSTSTGSSTFSTAKFNTNVKSSSSANGSVRANASGNSVRAYGSGSSQKNTTLQSDAYSSAYTTTTSTNTYKIPLWVSICAVEKNTLEPVWEVQVFDTLYREAQLQSVMPWVILSVQPYFGKSSHGEKVSKVNNTRAIKEKYNLIWPY